MASTGILRPHQSRISLLQRVIDAALILLTLYGATYLPRVTFDHEAVRDAYVMAGLLAVVTFTFTFIAETSRLYASWRGSTVVAEIIRAQWCWAIVVVIMLGLGFATKTSVAYSRVAMTLWFVATPLALSITRIIVRQVLRAARDRGYNRRTGAIVGSGPLAQ